MFHFAAFMIFFILLLLFRKSCVWRIAEMDYDVCCELPPQMCKIIPLELALFCFSLKSVNDWFWVYAHRHSSILINISPPPTPLIPLHICVCVCTCVCLCKWFFFREGVYYLSAQVNSRLVDCSVGYSSCDKAIFQPPSIQSLTVQTAVHFTRRLLIGWCGIEWLTWFIWTYL